MDMALIDDPRVTSAGLSAGEVLAALSAYTKLRDELDNHQPDPKVQQLENVSVLGWFTGYNDPPLPNTPIDDKTIVEPDRFNVDVLNQTERWIDRNGLHHRLEQMSSSYRRAVIGHLLDRAGQFYGYAVSVETQRLTVTDAISRINNGTGFVADHHPDAWIETTPLMKRLRELEDLPLLIR